MAEPIIVIDYDPSWPQLFETLRSRIIGALGTLTAAIEHVGSTAVPGLAAKPIIDIDVLLKTTHDFPVVVQRLADIGYFHRGDLGIPEREAFLTPPNDVPHHVYVCPPCSREFQRHVVFRDYLRAHPNVADVYGRLKKELAVQFPDNRSAYVAGKSEFVAEVMNLAVANSIGSANFFAS
jgi:GrpB-like predicted nucleotidyltransferase (UPF0157 family)